MSDNGTGSTGGDNAGGNGGTGDGGTDPGTGQNDGGQTPPDNGQDQGQGQNGGEGDVSSLPAWAQKELRDARADAGKARTNAKAQAADEARQDLAQQIGKALGLIKDGDAAPDPAKLAEQLAASQTDGNEARVELAVFKSAIKQGADPVKLLDSRSFLDKLKGVDPADDKKIGALISKAVEDNTAYRATTPPEASGAPMGGSPPTKKPKTLEAAVAARYKK
ncbi:hypothetical protein [Actinomadura decatromicini]|uniref:Scaffolding protein n=1 Tax=Actinomadura decatromicini TaxID=2604572 RepID=A0A5D3FFY3_9ACTN|nr:hypothetical protein [Actinomadura decatromicini]TYK47161.1 hypothetical protein FXF68_25500 [Actinomadura decatromicini]